MIQVRHAEARDAAQWAALRAALWPEEGCREFASDAVAGNRLSAAAHLALGFEEVVVIRCFRKDLESSNSS